MTREKFDNVANLNNKRRIALQRIVAILSMYAMILVCVLFHFEWWARYNWACILVSFVYLLFLGAVGDETHGVSIFRDSWQRLRDFADYSEAPFFANSFKDYYAPIRNGDYIAMSNSDYLKFDAHSTFVGKDIDFNSLYSMTVKLLDGDKIIYETKLEDYDYCGSICALYREVKEKGLDIDAIYNQFGDLKWRKSEVFKKKSKFREYRLKTYQTIWLTSQLFVAVLPVIFMFLHK